MWPQPEGRWLDVRQAGPVTVVTFLQNEMFDEEAIDFVGEELRRLVEEDGCRHLVLNFRAIGRMSTHVIGALLVLHKTTREKGGRLALCEFRPYIRETLDVLKLTSVFHVYDTEEEALRGG